MADKLEEGISDVHDRDYAGSLQEMERGVPVFGRITGMTDGLKEVQKELPFNFRQPINVVKAMFRLEPGLYTLHTGLEEDIQIGFRIEPSEADGPNKVPAVADNFALPSPDNSFYRNRILRLEGELHDADRKIRQQVDEIVGLKRELSEDKTATLLTHQRELADQKESHRNEFDRLKEMHRQELKDYEKQLSELEKVKFRMEMEQRAGGRDAGSRMLDMLEENAPMFFTVISQLFAGQRNRQAGSGQITEEQAQAMAASLRGQLQSTDSETPLNPIAHLDEANQPKGAGDSAPRRLPAEENLTGLEGDEQDPPLNELFRPEQRNGHHEPTMSV